MNTPLEEKFAIEMVDENKEVRKSKKKSRKIINEAGNTLLTLTWDKLNGRMGEC